MGSNREGKHEVTRKFPDGTYSRLFVILGLRSSEMNNATYKARIVVQGSNVTHSSGDYVYFSDTSSSPTNMCAIRSVIAYGELSKGGSSQADAEAAYIQPRLPQDIHFYVRVPVTIMTEEKKLSASKCKCPFFRLRKPLYGWSRSDIIWEKHLAETLISLDSQAEQTMLKSPNQIRKDGSWKPVDNWPQTLWKRNAKGQVIVLTVYVDDFVMAGPDHRKEWESIRKVITTTEPTIVDRVLGVHYTFNRSDKETRVTMDMCDYMKQALDMYRAVKDAPPFRNGVHYPWYEPTVNDISTFSNEPGIFAHCSASLLMKLMYACRMVRLDICDAINSLSRFVTKSNKLCDKQLRHLFSFLLQTQRTALQ
jgi:hypothetical protein